MISFKLDFFNLQVFGNRSDFLEMVAAVVYLRNDRASKNEITRRVGCISEIIEDRFKRHAGIFFMACAVGFFQIEKDMIQKLNNFFEGLCI